MSFVPKEPSNCTCVQNGEYSSPWIIQSINNARVYDWGEMMG